MDSPTDGILTVRSFEVRAHARPCTREALENLQREFEERLDEIRERESVLISPLGNVAEMLQGVDAVRLALRERLVEHDNARTEVLRIQQLIARGQVREAVIQSATVRGIISGFSDLTLDFVDEAQFLHERRQRLLITVGAIATAGLLVGAATIEILRRSTINKP